MKRNIICISILSVVLILSSCNKKIEQLRINPNQPINVTPNLLLQSVLTNMTGGLGGIEPWGNVAIWNQFFCRNYQYYGDNQYGWQSGPFGGYIALKNVTKMEEEAKKTGAADINPYSAIAKFAKAYYFYNMSSLMGNLPMNEALKGIENKTPVYDDQKTIFLQILTWLDEANDDFANLYTKADNTLIGDFYYNNDLTQWRKLVNTFKLRILISLSKKESDPELNIKTRFAAVFNDLTKYPVFETAADNFKFNYVYPYNPYPLSPNNFGADALRYNMAQTYVKNLTDINDARVFITCEPAWALTNNPPAGVPHTTDYLPTDFRAYVGASSGESIADMYSKAINGQYSLINRKRYYNGYTAEPFIIVGYTEMCFNIAEAINRGWITGNAEDWYNKGIMQSMNFYGFDNAKTNYTAALLPIGQSLGQYNNYNFTFSLPDYINQPAVKYVSGSTGFNQILVQKYLAFFQNSGWEAYFNYRRTGVPAFNGGTGIGNNGIIPKRWAYTSSEQSLNASNWKAALQAQQFNTDDINGSIWLIK